MNLHSLSGQLHKWIGLVIGLQVLFWIGGGAVMTWIPIEEVRSEHNIAATNPVPIRPEEIRVSAAQAIEAAEVEAERIELIRVLGQVHYLLHPVRGRPVLVDASTGEQVSPLRGVTARQIAEADFLPDAKPSDPVWTAERSAEYRGSLPVWQVAMNDDEGTNLYVSPYSGAITARRSDTWRLYDFFWMLHIMDYENRSDFNNPLVVWSSIIAVVLTVTGGVLLFFRIRKRDIAFLRRRKSAPETPSE